MSYLLDTHTFIWSLLSPRRLPTKAKKIILSSDEVYLSTISLWEISLKYSLAKISLKGIYPEDLAVYAKKAGFEIINLNADMASSFYKLPRLSHKDPFDRMLVWQAISTGYGLISKDESLSEYKNYGLKLIW